MAWRELFKGGQVRRGIAVDHARARGVQKRGCGLDITAVDTFVSDNAMPPADAVAEDLEQVGQAVQRLAAIDARLAELVDLKFFAGLRFTEIAALRGGSERTAQARLGQGPRAAARAGPASSPMPAHCARSAVRRHNL